MPTPRIECVREFARSGLCDRQARQPLRRRRSANAAGGLQRAYRTDPTSAFGGIIAFNRELDRAPRRPSSQCQFVEVSVRHGVSEAARASLESRPSRCACWCTGDLNAETEDELELRSVTGGLLLQQRDRARIDRADLKIVSRRQPDERELDDLLFAWQVAKFVKSNAIVFAREGATLGIGAGQMSRVYSTRLAALKAADEKLAVRGAVMASDAFFPFRDGIDVAAGYGIAAVIHPGGSKRDAEVIQAADEHGMAMVLTGTRHFRH